MMNENKLRRLLNENKTSMGTRILSSWPAVVEAVGITKNFDYIEYVAEYAPFTDADLENIARAAELHNMSPMIKCDFQNRFYVAQRAIASGFQAVMFTDHKTAKEVQESITAIRPDTPQDGGRFGRPNRRFRGYMPYMAQLDYAQVVRDTVVCIMIEKKDAIDNIEEICSVPGVDMVQFGPSDFSMSQGWNLKDHRPENLLAEKKMIEVALRHNVQPRCEINTVADAQYYIDLGVKHFCIGDEMRNNINYWTEIGGNLKKEIAHL